MTNIGQVASSITGRILQRREGEDTVGHTYRQILTGISTALVGRGIAIATNFAAVPLTVRYLGAERYGVWVTLTSILGWLMIFDLGIGNTSMNGVAEALAHRDFLSAKIRINTAYITLVTIAALIGSCLAISWHWISWPAVLGAKTEANSGEITRSAAIACFIFLANFPLAVTPRVLGACKKVTLANYWTSAGSLLSLLSIVVATHLKVGLPGLVMAISGPVLLVGFLSSSWVYLHYDWLTPSFSGIRRENVRELLNTGLPFFAVQLAGLVLFSTDNVIIAQIMGARSVTPYSITWKLFSYASVLQIVAMPSLWPAYADAFARRDLAWIRKTYRHAVRITIMVTIGFVVVLAIVARPFILLWAGRAAVPSIGLVLAMAFWTLLVTPVWCSSCLLGGAGRVRNQAIYSTIGAAVNIAASIWLGRVFGLVGIISGTICAYAICIFIPQSFEAERLLAGK